ncbi:hypothetical protein NC652_039452 [Populus alba x Populus x berolinensis]|nr:hypothetical protein NC652_039452 [Populus alba x Populus x berolinensis]
MERGCYDYSGSKSRHGECCLPSKKMPCLFPLNYSSIGAMGSCEKATSLFQTNNTVTNALKPGPFSSSLGGRGFHRVRYNTEVRLI